MEPHTKIMYPCPFCGEKTLQVLTWPGHTEIKSSRSAVAKSKTIRKISEGFELMSESCSNCGKTASEIKLAWKEGIKELDQDKRRKRLEELKKLGFAGVVNG